VRKSQYLKNLFQKLALETSVLNCIDLDHKIGIRICWAFFKERQSFELAKGLYWKIAYGNSITIGRILNVDIKARNCAYQKK